MMPDEGGSPHGNAGDTANETRREEILYSVEADRANGMVHRRVEHTIILEMVALRHDGQMGRCWRSGMSPTQ
jgi:hypothetical protein